MPKCTIPLAPCSSSRIAAAGYDPATETLALQFKKKDGSPGLVYQYGNVPALMFNEFSAAESKGKFFATRLQRHATLYPFTRMDEEEKSDA